MHTRAPFRPRASIHADERVCNKKVIKTVLGKAVSSEPRRPLARIPYIVIFDHRHCLGDFFFLISLERKNYCITKNTRYLSQTLFEIRHGILVKSRYAHNCNALIHFFFFDETFGRHVCAYFFFLFLFFCARVIKWLRINVGFLWNFR